MISRITPADYTGVLADAGAAIDARAVADVRLMVLTVLDAVLARCERDSDYPFIDTKLSLLTGEDFADDDPIRGRGRIYAWIQGRGLEALAGHELWLRRCGGLADELRDSLRRRIRRVLRTVVDRMESIRRANGGRLLFVMTAEGEPLRMSEAGALVPATIDPAAPANFSDLFYAKGLAAAATVLGDDAAMGAAIEAYARVDADLNAERFVSDQISLDPANPAIAPVPGRNPEGPRMIAIGAASRFLECTGDAAYASRGAAYIDHILRHHVNISGAAPSRRYDMWEFVDDERNPYLEDGAALRSDPGHACEFVGLAMKFLRVCERTGALGEIGAERLNAYGVLLPEVLRQNFANGLADDGVGVVKAVDLISRKTLHDDRPWWSLPETMRAAAEVAHIAPPDRRGAFEQIALAAAGAFARHYVRPDLHLMAYQTLAAGGEPVDAVPATPDADPGYHTGLSLIDCLDLWREQGLDGV